MGKNCDAFSSCHPGVCFAFFAGAIVFSVTLQHPAYLIAGLLAAAACCMSMDWHSGVRRLLGLVPVWCVLSAVNPLFNPLGEHVLFTVFGRNYTLEALYYGMAAAGMLVTVLLWFSCYSAVITSDKFLALFGGAAPSLTMLLVMVFRLVHGLGQRSRQILAARTCIGKGASAEHPLRRKLEAGMCGVSVLASWTLEGAVTTADSMNARGYGVGKRSSFRRYRMTRRDAGILAAMVVLTVLTLGFVLTGSAAAVYTPQMRIAPLHAGNWPGLAAYTGFLLIPSILNVRETLIWCSSKFRS